MPVAETVEATLKEVARCTRDDIRINTFMLDANSYLKQFVEKMTRMNKGRAFCTTPATLCDYVLVDFIEQRRALVQNRSLHDPIHDEVASDLFELAAAPFQMEYGLPGHHPHRRNPRARSPTALRSADC